MMLNLIELHCCIYIYVDSETRKRFLQRKIENERETEKEREREKREINRKRKHDLHFVVLHLDDQ